MPLISLSCDE
uniref:Uncharacterized protein n=1 Tax=Arundo donax TaxID=35708 RepID=A0A0A8Z3E4_ARUDO